MKRFAKPLFGLLLLSGLVLGGCVVDGGPGYVSTGVYYGPGPGPWFDGGYGGHWYHGGGYGFRGYRR